MTDHVLDIETTLDWNTIRLVGRRARAGNYICSSKGPIDMGGAIKYILTCIEKGDRLFTWNGSGFDLPMIKEHLNIDIAEELRGIGATHIDGCLMMKLLHPDFKGGHSLENVARKLFPNDQTLWKSTAPTEAEWYNTATEDKLAAYCGQDLKATEAACLKILKDLDSDPRWSGRWEKPYAIEVEVAKLIYEQKRKGVKIDAIKMDKLQTKLSNCIAKIDKELDKHLPMLPIEKPHYPPKVQFYKKTGEPNLNINNYCKKYGYEIHIDTDTPSGYSAIPAKDAMNILTKPKSIPLPLIAPLITEEKLEVTQTEKLKKYLMSIGWKPTMWNTTLASKRKLGTVTTSPKLSDPKTKEPCPNLLKVGVSWVPLISERLMLKSRLNIIEGPSGILNRWDPAKLTLASDADTLGTPTARFRHKNIVNIPRVTSPWGKEIRELYTARSDKVWVGWDAQALESCIEAHYTYPYDKDYAEMLVSGSSEDGTDVHTKNWKGLGLDSRDTAKTFKYAVTYGAQPPALARQLTLDLNRAVDIFNEFWKLNKGLSDYKKDLEKEWKSYGMTAIVGLDNRLIKTRSQHSLVNSSFQSGGAILMKYAMLIANATIRKKFTKEEAYGLIRYHDEEQWECDPQIAKEVGEIGVQSISQAATYLKLRVPVTGSYKIGSNWAETH